MRKFKLANLWKHKSKTIVECSRGLQTPLQEAHTEMNKQLLPFIALIASTASILSPITALAQSYTGSGSYPSPMPSTACYVPAGMMLNAALQTSIATEAAKPGDLVSAILNQPVALGNGQLPAGTILEGQVEAASAGGFLGRAGRLTIQFNRLRTPNGMTVPMSAHISGDLGKYKQVGNSSNSFVGEGMGTKVGQAALRTAIGAGAGAALGTAVGAIAGAGRNTMQYRTSYQPIGYGYGYGYGYGTMAPVGYYTTSSSGAARGAGRGAWSGAAIGGGLGLADSLLLRKGRNIQIPSGTPIKLQLDAPLQVDLHSQFGAT